MAELKLYGIPNCDITKKAMSWLDKNRIKFSFHDYKQQGISRQKLEEWIGKKGIETIFNKRSTTWRELSAAEQAKATDTSGAIKLMMENTSIIKRPVIEKGEDVLVGFNEEQYNKQLK